MRRALAALVLLCGGCCAPGPTLVPAAERPFEFQRDSFAFVNELQWVYARDPLTGEFGHVGDNTDASYTNRCFVLARSARQFFQFARFEPDAPRLDQAGYAQVVAAVIAHDPSEAPLAQRIVVPGYADLRGFSRDWEVLLKGMLGTARASFMQRGNWRMPLPFSHSSQAREAETLAREIMVNRPPIAHLTVFPRNTINHAILLYAVHPTPGGYRFDAYDPNLDEAPVWLDYDREREQFVFQPTPYWDGGEIHVYEAYTSLLY